MRYQRLTREEDLQQQLSQTGTSIVCGGTDLLVKLRAGRVSPALLLDISQIASLRGIRQDEAGLDIGAATPVSDILQSLWVQADAPLLVQALYQLGSVQIRNRATLGGNLVNASPAADSAVPLLLHDTTLEIVGPSKTRWLALEEFIFGPGSTQLQPGEYVRTLRLARLDAGRCMFYHKVGRRNAMTIAIASVGAVVRYDGSAVRSARLAAGSVAPTPLRLRKVEAAILGQPLSPDVMQEARRLAASSVDPITDGRASAEYRRGVVADLVHRALRRCAEARVGNGSPCPPDIW